MVVYIGVKMGLYNLVINHMADNVNFTRLLALLIHSNKVDDIAFPRDKLIGDLDEFRPGDRIKITWMDPYRTQSGFLFSLPGLPDELVVQIPENEDDPETQSWYVFKHLAITAYLIERDL